MLANLEVKLASTEKRRHVLQRLCFDFGDPQFCSLRLLNDVNLFSKSGFSQFMVTEIERMYFTIEKNSRRINFNLKGQMSKARQCL